MAVNDNLVRVGVTGSVYAAPVGTALPTNTSSSLNAAFVEVGHVTLDALTEQMSVTKELVRSWQRPVGIRQVTTEVAWTFTFQALETSELVLELYYGGATSAVATGIVTTTIPSVMESTEKAFVIQVDDGNITTRYVIPKGDITDRGEVPIRGTEGTFYEMTVAVLGTSIDALGYRITDDPVFAALAS